MTKRFTMVYGKYRDNLTNTEYDERLESWKICDLLNKYHEECKMYREDTLKAEKDKEELLEENKQLKKQLETANDDKKYVKQVIKDRIKHFHSYPCIDSSPQDHKGCWGLKMELEKFYDDVESYL